MNQQTGYTAAAAAASSIVSPIHWALYWPPLVRSSSNSGLVYIFDSGRNQGCRWLTRPEEGLFSRHMPKSLEEAVHQV